tara:strand:- start:968 stop:2968 length:2001 start_codon:yes stop_codon:yes gene_type:complete
MPGVFIINYVHKMKKSQLRNIIKEAVKECINEQIASKQLMTEQFNANCMEIKATICDPQLGESTQEWGYPSQTQFVKLKWSNGNTPQLGDFFRSTARGSSGAVLNYMTTWEVTTVGVHNTTNCVTRNQYPNCTNSNTFIYGCTDPNATSNYNPAATTNCDAPPIAPQSQWPNVNDPLTGYGIPPNNDTCNSDCIYGVSGCTDPTATNNYNPLATQDDGSCEWEGCTDPTANNYSFPGSNVTQNGDPYLTGIAVDNGSCTYDIFGCTDPNGFNYDPTATVDNGNCWGCMDPIAMNYCPLCNIDCSAIVGYTTDTSCCLYTPIPGCTHQFAINYNPLATQDDGTCEWEGCTDPTATNHSYPNWNPPVPHGQGQYLNGYSYDDGSCEWEGCTDPTANNYSFPGSNVTQSGDPYLTGIAVDNGTCDYTNLLIEGCADPTAPHCNTLPAQLQYGCYKSTHDGCGTPPNPNDTSCCQYSIDNQWEIPIEDNPTGSEEIRCECCKDNSPQTMIQLYPAGFDCTTLNDPTMGLTNCDVSPSSGGPGTNDPNNQEWKCGMEPIISSGSDSCPNGSVSYSNYVPNTPNQWWMHCYPCLMNNGSLPNNPAYYNKFPGNTTTNLFVTGQLGNCECCEQKIPSWGFIPKWNDILPEGLQIKGKLLDKLRMSKLANIKKK